MAQVRRNVLGTRNQENATIGPVGKNAVVGKIPAATKRAALTEIGNKALPGGILHAQKPVTKVAPKAKAASILPKIKGETSMTISNNVGVRPRPPLKKAASMPCIIEPIEDIDKDDKQDPFLAAEYVNDIFEYLREVEAKYPIRENYLEGQEISSKMRAVLVDWLVEVHQQFHLIVETLYMTVSILDRYLQDVRNVTRKKLQLVGVSAMYVASKYEEMYAPEVSDFVYICDNAYSKDEIFSMEQHIVKTLQFSFSRPLPLHFLRRYSKAAHAVYKQHQMAKYFLELSLVDYELCHYPPSMMAAAAMYLALWVFQNDKPVWTRTLVHYSTYTYENIESLVKKLARAVMKGQNSKCQAVYKKYAQSKFQKVSCMPELRSASLGKLAAS